MVALIKRLVFAIGLLLLPVVGSTQHCLSQRLLARKPAVDTVVADPGFEMRETATIEVVVHVVWRTPSENISTEQVLSQIAVLNEDFRLLNNNQTDILPIFQQAKADTEIEFALVSVDPAGNPSDGIVRVQTAYDLIGIARDENNRRRICYSASGGSDAWCPDRYLNIWIGQFPEGISGEASFPGQDTLSEDGIRIDPEHFGRTGTATPPYHLGRTTTHEIGHYLNLYHLWGGDGDEDLLCQFDDEVADTPEQAFNYRNLCPSGIQQSCGTPDMYQNYLNYTNDACMALFTTGQKTRMWATLNGPRSGLLGGQACSVATSAPRAQVPLTVFPNPAKMDEMCYVRSASPAFTLFLFDCQGKLWYRQYSTSAETSFSLSAIPPGPYVLQIVAAGRWAAHKLVITR
ncbi:MAG: zinc-dependent metalloprotease [Saprospiraceae bacterium]|nr:zinc-dependent metalloprotease [Saprospiraceae bacterium]